MNKLKDLPEPEIDGFCEHCEKPNPTWQHNVGNTHREGGTVVGITYIYMFCNPDCADAYLSARGC